MARGERWLSLMLALAAQGALAAGIGIPDLGAGALGQAGATIARPTDLTALYYNPAALTGLGGVQLYADVRAIDHRIQFQRLDASGANSGHWAQVENLGSVAVAPIVAASVKLGRATLAAGGHPFNGATGYRYADPASGQKAPQRYLGIESNSKIYVPVLAAALELAPWASVGAGLQLPIANFSARQAIYAGPVTGEYNDFDAILSVDATDWFARSGVLGVSLRPLSWLDVGASLQLQTHFRGRGTISAELPKLSSALGLSLAGNRIAVDVIFPWIARAGVRGHFERFSIELAGTYERWSALREIRITPLDVQVNLGGTATPLAPIVLRKDLQDAGSLRLGGEFRLLRWLVLRGGVLGETSAIPEERQALDWVHWQRLSLNAGVGARLGRFDASFALARFLQPERRVRDSAVTQYSALAGVAPTVVGNGDFDSRLTVAAASLSTEL